MSLKAGNLLHVVTKVTHSVLFCCINCDEMVFSILFLFHIFKTCSSDFKYQVQSEDRFGTWFKNNIHWRHISSKSFIGIFPAKISWSLQNVYMTQYQEI